MASATAVPNLTERAMLVNLSISQWSASKHDKKISREVADNHRSDETMGRFNKSLIAKSALENISQIASAARLEHYKLTLPWSDKGPRILSSAGYFGYAEAMRKFKSDWEPAIRDFLANYETYVQDARTKLNGLFDPADYPDLSKMARKFSFEFEITPMPTGEDFRVNLGAAETEAIRQKIQSDSDRMLARAMGDVWERMRDVVSKMSERLKLYQDTTGGKVANPFRDSLVSNITDLLGIIPSLNLTSDQNVAQFAQAINDELACFSPEQLRESESLRVDVATRADEILSKMSAFLG